MANDIESALVTKFNGLEALLARGPFDSALATIARLGGRPAKLQEVALARLAADPESPIRKDSFGVAECLVYFPEGRIAAISSDYSPLLTYAKEATDAHRNHKEFYISLENAANLKAMAAEDADKKPSEQRVHLLASAKDYAVPVLRFSEDALMQFLFKATAPEYAKLLQESGIKEIEVLLASFWQPDWLPSEDLQGTRSFVRPLWVNGIQKWDGWGDTTYQDASNSEICGREVDLSMHGIVFGVRPRTGAA